MKTSIDHIFYKIRQKKIFKDFFNLILVDMTHEFIYLGDIYLNPIELQYL